MSEIRMPNINNIMITGRLTRDPDIRFTKSNKIVVNFDIANNHMYHSIATDEWKKMTLFIRVSIYGNLADRVKERLHKGTPVYIEGRLQEDTWTTADNQQRKSYRIAGNRMQILEKMFEMAGEVEEKTEAMPDEEQEKQIDMKEELDDLPF